jgi:ParB-like chromosome segregation protein Spo0J
MSEQKWTTKLWTTRLVSELITPEDNPRFIREEKFLQLKESIKQDPDFLKVRPIVVNMIESRKNVVVCGNMRLRACQSLGMTEVPVVEVEVDELTAKRWTLKDNVSAGEWDYEALSGYPEDLLDDSGVEFESSKKTGAQAKTKICFPIDESVRDRVDEFMTREEISSDKVVLNRLLDFYESKSEEVVPIVEG